MLEKRTFRLHFLDNVRDGISGVVGMGHIPFRGPGKSGLAKRRLIHQLLEKFHASINIVR